MYFPVFVVGLRRLGRWLVYALFRLALGGAFALHTLGGLRSAWGGGGALVPHRGAGRAIRPRRTAGRARGGPLAQSVAA